MLPGCRFRSLISDQTQDAWEIPDGSSSSNTASQPSEREKVRAKILREVLVLILQVILAEGSVGSLIGAADEPGSQRVWCSALISELVNFETPRTSAQIACAGASAKTAASSCRRRHGSAFTGTSARRSTHRPQTICMAGQRKSFTEPRGERVNRVGEGGVGLWSGIIVGKWRGQGGRRLGMYIWQRQRRQYGILHWRRQVFNGRRGKKLVGGGEPLGVEQCDEAPQTTRGAEGKGAAAGGQHTVGRQQRRLQQGAVKIPWRQRQRRQVQATAHRRRWRSQQGNGAFKITKCRFPNRIYHLYREYQSS